MQFLLEFRRAQAHPCVRPLLLPGHMSSWSLPSRLDIGRLPCSLRQSLPWPPGVLGPVGRLVPGPSPGSRLPLVPISGPRLLPIRCLTPGWRLCDSRRSGHGRVPTARHRHGGRWTILTLVQGLGSLLGCRLPPQALFLICCLGHRWTLSWRRT